MKTRIPLKVAIKLAQDLLAIFAPVCERIEIAGSVRRQKPEVGDLEFVIIPKFQPAGQIDLFGQSEKVSQLDQEIHRVVAQLGFELIKDGSRHKKLQRSDMSVDLFITSKEQWGYIFALRTGPSEFNQIWLTQRNKGGLLPSQYRFNQGWLWDGSQRIETPDERGLFDLIGIGWIEPSERCAAVLKPKVL